MIITETLKNGYVKITSDSDKLIKHIPTNQVHSEYVVKEYHENEYIEIE